VDENLTGTGPERTTEIGEWAEIVIERVVAENWQIGGNGGCICNIFSELAWPYQLSRILTKYFKKSI
jgi:hypothetical protein